MLSVGPYNTASELDIDLDHRGRSIVGLGMKKLTNWKPVIGEYMNNETIEEKVARLNKEDTSLCPYNPRYTEIFELEKEYLFKVLPSSIIKRIEHFGSTAIPDIPSKPIVDLLVEVSCLEKTKECVVPILESLGYDYLWRPTIGMEPPWYAWFIKRDNLGNRTHHIHMIEADFQMWERLLFCDFLKQFPEQAKRYGDLKIKLSQKFPNDRQAYTFGKGELVLELTKKAQAFYSK